MPSTHRLRRGLLGYLIPFATHAFVPECQDSSSTLPSHLVFWLRLTDFTPTPAIPRASPCLECAHFFGGSGVELQDLTKDATHHLRTLYA